MPFEKFEIKKPEIPIGKGREVAENLHDWLLLFEKVKNKVAFVNKEVYTPLKLEKGKENPLGLFPKSAIPELFQRKPGEQRLETWPRHERSAILGRAIFKDKQGRFYRDIDLKGIGHIERKKIGITGWDPREKEFLGLLESKDAFKEYKFGEKFLSAGIRAPRTLAIINLEEIIEGGKKFSLKEARKKGVIKEDFQPVVEVRGFGTKARISDIFFGDEWLEETKKLLFEDAKKLVSQELERGDNPLTDQEYLEWFAETLGKNVGLMHKNGWLHSNLTSHNITLDCRICDLDTVKKLKGDEINLDKDYAQSSSIQRLARWLDLPEKRLFELFERFQKSYDSVFPPEERKLDNKGGIK
jgi:hypothetical protein